MLSFREIVEMNPAYFKGTKRETEKILAKVEGDLNVILPEDLKWLLLNHGYGECIVAPNIQESISDTLRFRRSVELPHSYIVLEDLNDAGVVLLDTQSTDGAVIWLAIHCISELKAMGPTGISDSDYFPNLASWVSFRLREAKEENAT